MKSKLELSNSWKGFLDEMQGALQARDYRKETIKAILQYVDPDLSFTPGSFWQSVKGEAIGCGFASGRDALYGDAFERFLQRKRTIFENAPIAVIKVFNELVNALFSEKRKKNLLLDEQMTSRHLTKIEKEFWKAEKAKKSVAKWVSALQKDVKREKYSVEGPQETTDEKPEEKKESFSLFSPASPLDEETKKVLEQEFLNSKISEDQKMRDNYVRSVAALEEGERDFQSVSSAGSIFFKNYKFSRFVDLSTAFQEAAKIDMQPLLHRIKGKEGLCESDVSEFFVSKKKTLQGYLKQASDRAEKIDDLVRQIGRMKETFEPFLRREDTKDQVKAIFSQLNTLTIPDALFLQQTEKIEKEIAERIAELGTLTARVQGQFKEVLAKVRDIEIKADFLRDVLLTSRWELFSGKTPYPDLDESIEKARDEVMSRLKDLRQTLINGKLSFLDFVKSSIDTIYEHDVKFIRGEMKSRAFRLKDVRNAVCEELRTLDRYLSLLHLGKRFSEKLFAERAWLYSYLTRLTQPFLLCKDMYDPQAINILFRYWWGDVEKFLQKKEERKRAFFKAAEGADFIRPLLQTLDLAEKLGGVKGLYETVQAFSKEARGVALLTLLEKWCSFSQERVFFCQVATGSLEEQEQQLTAFFQLQKFMAEIIDFGSAIQAVKTYEPERVQSILEVNSLLLFSSFQDGSCSQVQLLLDKMRDVMCAVEDELVLEVGLIDQQQRMETGFSVARLLPKAMARAPGVISRLESSLKLLIAQGGELSSRLAENCERELKEVAEDIEKSKGNEEKSFAAFQRLSVLLCQKRAASSEENFAKVVVLFFSMQYLAKKLLLLPGVGSRAKIDELCMLGRKMWDLLPPTAHQQEMLRQLLFDMAPRLRDLIEREGLKEETKLAIGVEKLSHDLSQKVRMNVPRLSFVPGDLSFFWKG